MTESRRRASSTRTAGGSASRRHPPVDGPRTDGPDHPHEDIARRAYELYEERGAGHGHDWEDWFRAERELRSRRLA